MHMNFVSRKIKKKEKPTANKTATKNYDNNKTATKNHDNNKTETNKDESSIGAV